MVNPLLTVLVDLALVGGALFIAAAMVAEAWTDRRPSVGSRRPGRATQSGRPESAGRRLQLRYAVGSRRVA